MPELRRDRAAVVIYLVGATGSGKSHRAARFIRAHRGRVLVWDLKDDHPTIPRVRDLADLARRIHRERALRYVPQLADLDRQFDLFCRIAWAMQAHDPSTDLLFLVEELPEVTQPGRAPPTWRRIVLQGRVYGFTVMATTQAPAFVDKSFTGSATYIAAGRLGEMRHAREIGQRINVDPGVLQRLPDRWAYVFDGRETQLEKPRR